jgi:hypothetical protein
VGGLCIEQRIDVAVSVSGSTASPVRSVLGAVFRLCSRLRARAVGLRPMLWLLAASYLSVFLATWLLVPAVQLYGVRADAALVVIIGSCVVAIWLTVRCLQQRVR